MCNNLEESNMKERHADQGHRKFWSLMKEMTWKERFTHIWYYYARYILLAICILYIIGDVLYESFKEKPIEILSGTAINVSVSTTMERKLTDELLPYISRDDLGKQTVTLVPNKMDEWDIHNISTMRTKLLSGDYDYVLMDQVALDTLISMQALPSLKLLLPEEEVAKWEGSCIAVQSEGETHPIALDITGTPLAAECGYTGERLFLGFPVNQNTATVVEPFYNYLMEQGLLTKP